MNPQEVLHELEQSLFQSLVSGDRQESRRLVQQTLELGIDAESLSRDVYWSVLDTLNTLYRNDQVTALSFQYATRLLRSLVDQAQASYRQAESRGRRICMFCGETESDDLAGQLVADLAEADGYEMFFGGGGIANDEILEEVNNRRPDILLLFSSGPRDAPNIRQLIDTIRGVNACPEMQIVVGGGIFNRAPGLAEEIGADLWATSPRELLTSLEEMPMVRSELAASRAESRNARVRKAA
ncbi:MAG: cobalamin B12-binding domain-containing protein [Phycisphaerales bacterium]|jgi:methanogenic corrinoid protein MtbC1